MDKAKTSKHASRFPDDHIAYRKNKYAAPVGGIYLLLALIGLIAVGIACVTFTKNMLDNTGEKQEFSRVIAPVMMFDPVPFESPADADSLFLLQTSLWNALMDKGKEYRDNPENYDSLGRIALPASDVDVACARLFGPDITLEHQSFGDYETSYVYDEDTKTYYTTISAQTGMYTPYVARIVKRGDEYTLTVGYVPPTNIWLEDEESEETPHPDKYMVYVLQKMKDHYQLLTLRDPTPEELEGLPEANTPLQLNSTSSGDSSSSQAA